MATSTNVIRRAARLHYYSSALLFLIGCFSLMSTVVVFVYHTNMTTTTSGRFDNNYRNNGNHPNMLPIWGGRRQHDLHHRHHHHHHGEHHAEAIQGRLTRRRTTSGTRSIVDGDDDGNGDDDRRPLLSNIVSVKKKTIDDGGANNDNGDDDGDDGSLSCDEVLGKYVDEGTWKDPNEGKLHARKMIQPPSFYVSVHDESYDPVRWKYIYDQGKYYEDVVYDRFRTILGENNGDSNNGKKKLVIDVGANIGYYTLLSASLGHDVISFEINPPNLLRLCESIRINGYDDVSATMARGEKKKKKSNGIALYQKGVSDVDGALLQVFVPKNPGQAYMRELDADTTREQKAGLIDAREIQEQRRRDKESPSTNLTQSIHHSYTTTVKLDAFAEQRGWFELHADNDVNQDDDDRFEIALLKLDVEGKEPKIIDGAKKVLRSGMVRNVLTEFRRLSRPQIQEAITTLLESGYTLVEEKNGGKLSIPDARKVLKQYEDKYKRTGTNIDFWFQRV